MKEQKLHFKASMFSIIIFSIITCIMMESCNNRNTLVSEFPESKSITGKPIKDIQVITNGNVNLNIVDSLLIIQTREEPFFRIYNTQTFEEIFSFGKYGRGPNEFIYPTMNNQIIYDSIKGESYFIAYDYSRRNVSKININKAIQKNNECIDQKSLGFVDGYIQYFYYDDNDIVICTLEGGGRLSICMHDESIQDIHITQIPEVIPELKSKDLSSLYRSFVEVNKDKGMIACGRLLFPQIDFFDIKGNYVKTIEFGSVKNANSSLDKFDDKSIVCYVTMMQSTDDLIYSLFYNNNQSPINPNPKKNFSKIHVYDWHGNPKEEYIIKDERTLKSFTIDKNNGKMFAYDDSVEKDNIIMYNLD